MFSSVFSRGGERKLPVIPAVMSATAVTDAESSANATFMLEERVRLVNHAMDMLKAQHTSLSKGISELLKLQQAVPCMVTRWNSIKSDLAHLLAIEHRFTSHNSRPFTLDDCNIVLECTIRDGNTVWNWLLKYPEDTETNAGVRHRKVLSLNYLCVMPAFCEKNELFVKYLANNNFIDMEIK